MSSLCFRTVAQTPEYRASWADAFHTGYLSKSAVTTSIANIRAGRCNVFVPEVYVNKGSQLIYWNPTPSEYPDLGASGTIISNGTQIQCDLNSDPETNSGGTYDALAECIAQGHNTSGGKQRIDIWAWFVSFRSAGAVPAAHPSWITVNATGSAQTDFDPGHPGAAQQLYNNVMDVVKHYDVDGINFDYIRLTDANNGFNPISIQRYNAIKGTTGTPTTSDSVFKQWRRDQITNIVRKIYLNTIAIKPNVRVSADTITWGNGPTRPAAGDPNPLATWKTSFASSSAYSSVLQDWRSWMEEGILDIAVPMAYFRECTYQDAFNRWSDFTKDIQYGRQAMIGPGGYLNSLDDAYAQMKRTRLPSSTMGKYGTGASNYSYAVPYADSCGGTQISDPAGWSNYLANGTTTDPVAIYPTTVPLPDLPRLSNGKGHMMGIVTNTLVPSPGWVDGGTITITGPASKTMKTDGTGFYGFVDIPPGTYSVTATAPGVTSQTKSVTVTAHSVASCDFAMSLAVPTHLAFTRQPAGAFTGQAFSTQPMVAALDASNNLVSNFSGSITLSIKPGTGASEAALVGTTTVSAVNGVATFPILSISKPGTGYVLTADSGSLTSADSAPFDVRPLPTRLEVAVQPVAGVAGAPFSVQPVVNLRDDLGNLCTDFSSTVSVFIKTGTGPAEAMLAGTTTMNAVNGVAAFTNLTLSRPGAGYVLRMTSPGLAACETDAFSVLPAAVKLVVDTHPQGAMAGQPLATQPVVSVQDDLGNVCAWSSAPVTISIKSGTGNTGAELNGTKTVNAVNGVVTFGDLSINKVGFAYRLTATGGDLTPADTLAFDITTTAVSLAFQTQPGGARAGLPFATQPVIVARNADNGIAADYDGIVTVNIKEGTGVSWAILNGTASVAMVNGIGTFTDLQVSDEGPGFVLTAAGGSLPEVDSAAFDVVSGEPYALADALNALRITAGITSAGSMDVSRLNIDGVPGVDLLDATLIARKVTGLDPNP